MEAELDAQVARIEKQAREKAKLENECEKRELQDKMEIELQELKAQLKLFQKVAGLLSYKESFLRDHEFRFGCRFGVFLLFKSYLL